MAKSEQCRDVTYVGDIPIFCLLPKGHTGYHCGQTKTGTLWWRGSYGEFEPKEKVEVP